MIRNSVLEELRVRRFADHNMWSQFTNVTDIRTDRQTDRRHTIAIPRFALQCIAR